MADRPIRGCDACGQEDDHPRHVIAYPERGESATRHIDCCAAQGCETCQASEADNGGLRGQELIDHLDEVRN